MFSRSKVGSRILATLCFLILGLAVTAHAQPTYQLLAHFSVPEGGGATPYARLVKGADGSFYGTTNSGGTHGVGTIYKITAAGAFTLLHSFAGADGSYPFAGLIQAVDGNFYGSTTAGGANNSGTIFKMDAAGTVTTLKDFAVSDGAGPYGELVQGSDGLFYGTTSQGGAFGYGTVFRIDALGSFTTLFQFSSGDGATPYAALIQGSDGRFYGTTSGGGSGGFGTVFAFNPGSPMITLHNFVLSDGATPLTSLVQGIDGRLYGTTSDGGATGLGTIYRVDLAGIFTSLHQFVATDPAFPLNDLMTGSDGSFYATSPQGGVNGLGAMVRVASDGTVTLLNSFAGGAAAGAAPHGALFQDTDNSFYGTTINGGASDLGSIFKIASGGAMTTLHTFISSNAASNPNAALVQATDGSFYGTTTNGGSGLNGTIFHMDAAGNLSTFHNLVTNDGANPYAHLIQGIDGRFYGTTSAGGVNGSGTVFAIDGSGVVSVLHSFVDTDGTSPNAGLLHASDGSLYGTTAFGGSGFAGTIFKIDTTGTLTTLYNFDYTNGAYPYAVLTDGGDGFFYGTTTGGGSDGSGVIFKIDASGTYTSLHSFSFATEGAYAYGGLIKGRDGLFYGTTNNGGSGFGTVFSTDAAGNVIVLHTFDGTDGANPSAALVQGGDGRLYGTTTYGGASFLGTLFRLKLGGPFQTIHEFNWSDGAYPNGALIQAADGTFYGTASEGGPDGGGAVFSLSMPNGPPVISNPGDQANAEGNVVSVQLVATDPDLDVPTYSATNLPGGLSVNPVSGLISGTINYSAAGTYSVTVSASDGIASSSQSFTWTVANTNRPPVLTNPGTLTSAEAQVISRQLVASDPDGDPVTFTGITGLPATLSMSASGLISGTLTYTSAGSYSVTATVSDGLLSSSQTFTWNVANTDRAPVLTNPGPQSNLDAASYAAGVVADAPSAYWRLGEPSGTSVGDSAGSTTGSVLGGVTLGVLGATADGNKAMTFNGTTGYLAIANPAFSLAGNLSIELWVKPASLATRQTLISKDSAREFELTLETSGNLNLYEGNGTTGQNFLSAAGAIVAGSWQHVVVTRDTATNSIHFYVNGVAKGSATYSVVPVAGTKAINIGRSTGVARYTNGSIDEVALYPSALSQAQAAAHYALRVADGNGTVVTLPLVATDPDGDTLSYSATGLPPGLSINSSTGVISGTLSPASAGVYSVTATTSDGALTNSQVFSWTVTHINRPPVLSNPGSQASPEGAAISLQLAASDADGDTLTYSASGYPASLSFNPSTGLISGTLPFTSAGAYTVVASVSDGHVSATQSFTWTVANTNRPPVLANPGAQSNLDHAGYPEGIQADSPSAYWRLGEPAGTVAADVIGSNAGAIVGGVTLGQPGTIADGNTAMLFNGTTGYVNIASPAGLSLAGDLSIELWLKASLATRQTLISRSSANEFEVTLETSGNLNFYQGNGVTTQNFLSAAGAVVANTWQHIVITRTTATKTIAFYVNGVAKGTAVYTVVPTASVKPINIGRSTAASRYVNGSIDEVALYPSALSASQVAAHYTLRLATGANTPVSLQLVANDPDGDALTYSGTGLPPGLSVNATSGLISGTLTSASAGVFNVTVSASDGSLSASQSFVWTVTHVNQPPVLTNPGSQSSAEGQVISLQLLGSDPEGSPLTYSVSGLPASLGVDAATGLISGTLPFTSAGSYSVTAIVSDGSLSAAQTFTWTVANTNRAPIVTNPGSQANGDNTSYGGGVLADVPTAYWRLGELAGTTAADSAGGNTAAIVGGVTLGQAGPIADGTTAMLLNGTTGYLSVANPAAALNGDLSIELWANVSLATRQTLISKDAAREFELTVEPSGNLHFYQGDGVTSQNFLSAAGAVAPNTWQHIVVTRSTATNTIRFYVNGVAKGSAVYTVVPAAGTKAINIGRSTGAVRYVNGSIDEVAIYPSALSAAQIGVHYGLRTATGTGTPISLQVIASDPDGDPMTFSASGLPAGLSISSTGLISGTLTVVSDGTSSVTVSVSDGVATTTQTFTWTVTHVGV